MKNKNLFYIASLVVLFAAAGNASALDVTWDAGAGPNDANWTNANNWNATGFPNTLPVKGTTGTPGNLAKIFPNNSALVNALVKSAGPEAFQVKIGGPAGGLTWSTLTVSDGGILNSGEWLMAGIDSSGIRSGELIMTGGTINLGQVNSGNGHLFVGHSFAGTKGFINMSGGTITATANFAISNGTGTIGDANLSGDAAINANAVKMNVSGAGTATMTLTDDATVTSTTNFQMNVLGGSGTSSLTLSGDATINTGVNFEMNPKTDSGAATIDISGNATINTANFQMDPCSTGTASVSITGNGKLIIDGDVTGTINTYISDGWITTPAPDDPNDPNATIMVTYSSTDDKTTVWVMGNQRKFGNYDGLVNSKLTLQNCDGNDVTFGLTGGGYGEIDSADCNFASIILHNTTAKSSLTIKTKGKIETDIGDIVVGDADDANGLKSIVAKTTNLQGSITINGSIKTLTLGDVADDHTITIGEYPDANNITGVQIKFDQVADTTINSELPIKKLTATEWLGGSIDAPSIGTISITGKKTPLIAGDLDVNVVLDSTISSVTAKGTLSGEWTCDSIKSITAPDVNGAYITLSRQPDLKLLALGKLTAKRRMDYSEIQSTGNIGTVSVGKMANSSCFAGVTNVNDVNAADDVLDLPVPATDINDTAPLISIKSITIKGIKSDADANSFINSNVAAAQITTASLYYPQYDNNDVPFGLAADYIKTLKVKDAGGTQTVKGLNDPNDSGGTEDFVIRIDQLP